MKKELRKITNLTLNNLLEKDVILPSIYFEEFNNNAASIEIDLSDDNFQKEISKLMVEEYNNIESYMGQITSNISIIKESTKEAKSALLNKNLEQLSNIYKRMIGLESEIDRLHKKIYYDETSNILNKKWIYNKFLDKESCFKQNGVCVLIDITDYEYVKEEYGELLANNLILFLVNFIRKNLKNEIFEFKIAKFFENKLVLFIENETLKDVNHLIINIEHMLTNTTLKSNSGLMIKACYKFVSTEFFENQDSKDVFEKLFHKLKEV